MEAGHLYTLNFVGKNTYGSPQKFQKEALSHGVNRHFPSWAARRFHFGDPILLAFYEKPDKARVFGYYTVDGINTVAPEWVKQALVEALTVVRTIDHTAGGSSPGLHVTRGCGEYTETSTHYVKEDVPEIIELFDDLCQTAGVKGDVFLGGRFHPIPEKLLYGPKFCRAGVWAVTAEPIAQGRSESVEGSVTLLADYERKKYWKQQEAHPFEEVEEAQGVD